MAGHNIFSVALISYQVSRSLENALSKKQKKRPPRSRVDRQQLPRLNFRCGRILRYLPHLHNSGEFFTNKSGIFL